MGHQPSCLGKLLALVLNRLTHFRDRRVSADPATPADPVVAGSPRELSGMTPVAPVRAPAITSSCSVSLRSGLRLATDSRCGCSPAPCGAHPAAVAADHHFPSSLSRFVG